MKKAVKSGKKAKSKVKKMAKKYGKSKYDDLSGKELYDLVK